MSKPWVGFLSAEITEWDHFTPEQIAAQRFEISRTAKKMEDFADYTTSRVITQPSYVGTLHTWKATGQRPATSYSPARNWKTEHKAFENCVFNTRFEIGRVRSTSSTSEVILLHKEFDATMFIRDFFDILHWVKFDTSDSLDVKKYIEGDFTFQKRGSAITLVGVQ